MKIAGVTGGIGSGKSTVVKMFEELGVPIYVADKRAKKLMRESKDLKIEIVDFLGKESYKDGELNRPFIAKEIFNDVEKLNRFNAMVHPAVHADFKKWKADLENNYTYCIYEAAILFESNRQEICDYTLLITAPKEVRIKRVMNRDNITETDVIERMNHQWSDERKKKLADFIIYNMDLDKTKQDVNKIHKFLTRN